MNGKKIRKAVRGLTFSLEAEQAKIGARYSYIIDKNNQRVVITEDIYGKNTVSRKRCGKEFKPLYDIRSKEVKELVSSSDYLEVEVCKDQIIVHIYKQKAKSVVNIRLFRGKTTNIREILGIKTGEIILDRAVGGEWTSYAETAFKENDYLSSVLLNKPPENEIYDVYKVASLFSGAGLLDYSFLDPKFEFVYGVDFCEDACKTYRENIGDHIQCKDIRTVTGDEIPDVDVILGGPCCQTYSNANRVSMNSRMAEEKRLLVDDYVRLTKEKRPKVFVIENVPQLLSKEDGMYLDRIICGLSGYEISYSIVSDDDLGGYSARKRAIIIGSRVGKIEIPDVKVVTKKTVKDALLKVTSDWFNFNNVTTPASSTVEKMSYVPQGGNWKSIPESVHKFGQATQSNTYRRLAWDEVSPTITNWRKCNLTHPVENRILTVSEAASIMGLDKNFKVFGSTLNSKQQQVGNGVTQAIGKFVKRLVIKALDSSKNKIQIAMT